jgi:uncharacterized protein (TIGR03435 family)
VSAAQFLAEWTLRSSVLIGAGVLLLWAFRIKDSSIRLASWTAMLFASVAVPFLVSALPPLALPSLQIPASAAPLSRIAESPGPVQQMNNPAAALITRRSDDVGLRVPGPAPQRLGRVAATWSQPGVLVVYVLGASASLLRMLAGLTLSFRLRRSTTATGASAHGIEIRVSDRVSTPVTLGILRPVIVLPVDWREWDATTLQSVLAHERSHVQRRDPAVQVLSLLHRAALWHNPLTWYLHRQLVRAAEDASDDAAVTAAGDRTRYAEILLAFMQRKIGRWSTAGVPMARYGSTVQRIDRILDGTHVSHGVGRWTVAAIVTIGMTLACIAATAQSRPEFEVADVHLSPLRPDGRSVTVMEGGGGVRGGRYEIYEATLVDLIMTAYDVRSDAVLGGPSWLGLDRFDVIAKPPANASPDSVNAMLQALLADRFKLVARSDTRPMPAWVLSKGAGEPKLRRPSGTEKSGCRNVYELDRLSCRNVPLEAFIAWLREGPATTLPVVNSTRIDGSWDFDLDNLDLPRNRGVSEGNPILTSVDRQLGLRLAVQPVPQPVVLVNVVNRTPTPNLPGIERRLPPDPIEFEVAAIRPCDAIDPRRTQGDIGQRISPGGQLTTGCLPLRFHIINAWNIGSHVRFIANRVFPNMAQATDIQGAPAWMASRSFNIVAKAPIAMTQPLVNDVKYRAMLRNLLAERFKMKTHYEDRPVDVYTLVAPKPNLKKADPSNRTGCRSNGLVVGVATVITCQNVTMAQFVDELNRSFVISASGRRVVDETGMEGNWDVTLSYRTRPPAEPTPGVAPEPTDELSPFEAVEKQLGLKLTEAKRPMPVFVIDHIEENPTEN